MKNNKTNTIRFAWRGTPSLSGGLAELVTPEGVLKQLLSPFGKMTKNMTRLKELHFSGQLDSALLAVKPKEGSGSEAPWLHYMDCPVFRVGKVLGATQSFVEQLTESISRYRSKTGINNLVTASALSLKITRDQLVGRKKAPFASYYRFDGIASQLKSVIAKRNREIR